jgi:hypothetical protein
LLSPNDEFANYELYSGLLGLPDVGSIDRVHYSFGRQAYKDGIAMQDSSGYNPYKFGMAGGSDSHNTGSPYSQDDFYGGHAEVDGTVERRMAGVMLGKTLDVRLENPGGLTGVWAEKNSRASIWDAMYRKETLGVSGPHILGRFFCGCGYKNSVLNARDWVPQSYASGVRLDSNSGRMLGCNGSRYCTRTKAMPVSVDKRWSNRVKASKPPADAPMPTMARGRLSIDIVKGIVAPSTRC